MQKPSVCRTVLYYPVNYASGELMDPLPMIITHVTEDNNQAVCGVVLNAMSEESPALGVRYIAHISVPMPTLTSAWAPRWDWPPRV